MKARLLLMLFILSFLPSIRSQYYISEFKTGMFTAGAYSWLHNPTIYGELNNLHVNQTIKYTFHRDFDDQYQLEGGFYDALTGYSANVSTLVSSLVNYNQQVLLEREKIVRPAYGQQSDYEAEITNPSSYYPGYGYSTHLTGTPYGPDTYGVSGYRCSANVHSADYVLMSLYENQEQINAPGQGELQQWNIYDHQYYLSDNKLTPQNDWKWYVLPRMRINDADADLNPPKAVVTLEIYDYNGGSPIRQITIYTNNFQDQNGNYNGEYKEQFRDINLDVFGRELNQGNDPLTDGRSSNPAGSQVDYRIKWEGEVDVWIDRVRVEDEWAHFLFNPGISNPYDFIPKIQEETTGLTTQPFYFYMDEFQYNQVPCIAKVNQIIKTASNDQKGLISLVNDWWWTKESGLKNPPSDFSHYVDKVDPPALMVSAYPFDDYVKLPPGVTMPNTITYPGTENYIQATTNGEYNSSLQSQLDNGYHLTTANGFCSDIDLPSFMGRIKKAASSVAGTQVPFVFNAPVHAYEEDWKNSTNGCKPFVSRDQTVNELGLMPQIALCYGAKQISYWWLPSLPLEEPLYHNWGLLEVTNWQNTPNPRYENYYGEQKWTNLIAINQKLNLLGNIMFPLSFQNGRSVHLQGAGYSYISDIMSIDPHKSGQNPCTNDYQTGGYPYGPYMDCPDERYWELGFFDDPNSAATKYLMLVNRRCAPAGGSHNADNRALKIKFNGANLPGSLVNWKITNAANTSQSVVFSRNNTGYVDLGSNQGDLGWFQPGEGKLFKIEPVMPKGGTLVADEVISGQTFTCEDTVYNNGYNITINGGSTISFTDSACIIMNGGTFTSGVLGEQSAQTTYKGVGSNKWSGLQLNGATVKIYNSKFQDISSPVINYAVKMVNCPLADIRTNQFVMSSDTSGAVQSVYLDGDGLPSFQCLYIAYNNITMNNSRANGVMVQGFSGLTLPVYIMNNTMTSNGYAEGVMLSSVTGGSVKNNSVTGFAIGINSLLSTVNVFGNTITNTSSLSKGILVTGSTTLSLIPSGGLWLGGFNTITNTSGASVNIEVNNSAFTLGGGKNTFDVTSSAQSYHLYGSFYSSRYSSMANDNCFKLSGTEITSPNLPRDSVLDGSTEITFNYSDYLCGGLLPEGQTIVDLGNGLYDTIPGSSGEGAGGSSVNTRLPLDKGEKQRGSEITTTPSAGGHPSSVRRGQFTLLTPKAMYDTVRVRLARQNYAGVKSACYDLINTYPDSLQSILSLQMLYLSTIMTDTTYAGLSQLKTYYETLILNHPGNTPLVSLSNYMAQKCKVMLKEYSSALAGFQQIINNNPYSYEGLAAKWDYMATSLLSPGGGGENSKPEIRNPNYDENVESVPRTDTKEELYWGDDKNPFTKEEKQQIISSVKNAFEQAKNDDEVKIQKLEEAAETGDINAEKQLNTMKTLKQIVRTEKPHNIMEHINIVSSDVQKVFGNTQPAAETKTTAIPQVFSLSQNFPNPFNPVTTIRYALPKDVKVVVKIYDILGREVKTLVNEIQQAGYYDVKFDMSSYASGVYFYRIEVRQAGSSTVDFAQSKKMVLVK